MSLAVAVLAVWRVVAVSPVLTMRWFAEGSTKEDLGRPEPGEGHEAHAFFEVAVAGEEFERFLDEGLRIERMRLDWSRWMRSW